MPSTGGRRLVIVLAVIVVVSMVGPAVAMAGGDQGEFREVPGVDGVEVWERAVFSPLHVDYSANDPQTIVRHPEPTIETDGEQGKINRHQAGVWGPDQTIPLTFESRTGAQADQFNGTEMDLIVARTDGDSVDLGGIDTSGNLFSAQRAMELFGGDAEADWEYVETKEFIENEELEFGYDLSKHDREPGGYAFFLVKNDTVGIQDGNVSDVDGAKVYGLDTTVVQDAKASVEPEADSYEPGEDLEFDVETNHPDAADEGQFTHAVLVFNETDFREADGEGDDSEDIVLQFDGNADDLADASADDFTLDTSFGTVQGVLDVDEDADAFGLDPGGHYEEGEIDVQTMLDALLTEADLSDVTVKTGDSTLNASLTVICSTESDETVTVGTTEDFAEGEYDVLYLAEGRDEGQFSSARSTVTIESDSDRGGGPPPWVPGPGPGPSPPAQPPAAPGPKVDVQPNGNAASIAFERVEANTRNVVEFPERVGTERVSLAAIAIDTRSAHDSLDMSVSASDTVPGDTPDLDIGEAISYLEVTVSADEAVEYNEAEFTFRVDEETLEDRGISQDRVRLFRYSEDDQEWQQLPTEHQGGDTYVATSPGFSVFAVGAAEQQQQPGPSFEISDASVDETDVEAGDTVEVSATVENTGDEQGTFTVDLTVDGEVVDSTDVTLDAGESTGVGFEHSFEDAGNYEVAVGGEAAGTVQVSGSAGPGGPVEEGLISPGVVLLIVLVLLVLGAGVAYYLRNGDAYDFGA